MRRELEYVERRDDEGVAKVVDMIERSIQV